MRDADAPEHSAQILDRYATGIPPSTKLLNSFHLARPTLPLLPRPETPIISPSARLASGIIAIGRCDLESMVAANAAAAASPSRLRSALTFRRNSFHLTVLSRCSES